MTQHQTRQIVIRDRAEWAALRDAFIRETAAQLTAIAVADYEHQTGPRGLTMDAGRREARESIAAIVSELQDIAENCLDGRYLADRRA